MLDEIYPIISTFIFPTTPSNSFIETVCTPNVFIVSFKSTFFLSIFILCCFSKASAMSFAETPPNIFPFSPAFTGIFNNILESFSAIFFASSFSCDFLHFYTCIIAYF